MLHCLVQQNFAGRKCLTGGGRRMMAARKPGRPWLFALIPGQSERWSVRPLMQCALTVRVTLDASLACRAKGDLSLGDHLTYGLLADHSRREEAHHRTLIYE